MPPPYYDYGDTEATKETAPGSADIAELALDNRLNPPAIARVGSPRPPPPPAGSAAADATGVRRDEPQGAAEANAQLGAQEVLRVPARSSDVARLMTSFVADVRAVSSSVAARTATVVLATVSSVISIIVVVVVEGAVESSVADDACTLPLSQLSSSAMAIDTDEAIDDGARARRRPAYGQPVHERQTTPARRLPRSTVQPSQGGNLLTLVTPPLTGPRLVANVRVPSTSPSVKGRVVVAVVVIGPDVAVAVGVTSIPALLV